MLNTDPRTKNYRSSRLRMWEELTRKYESYVLWFQEDPGVYDDAAKLHVHPLDGTVNVFLDELLTHLPREQAVALVHAMLPGWGLDPNLVVLKIELVRSFIERSHPDVQWGTGQVDPAVASDPPRWRSWLKARLDALGIPTERVFQETDFGVRHGPPAAPAPRRPWLLAIGLGVLVGGATFYVLETRRRSLEEGES